MLRAIENLASYVAAPCSPWEVRVQRPDTSVKSEFVAWCQNPTTKNCHYSASEGLDPLMRIGKDNPVVLLHGIVADYDFKNTFPDIPSAALANCKSEFAPNWSSSTFSNGIRLVWLFSEPIPVAGQELAEKFYRIVAQRLKLSAIFPGLDMPALVNSTQYFDVGKDWKPVSNDMIPMNFVHHWMFEAGEQMSWPEEMINIPIEIIAEQAELKFPGRWKGPFEIGQRGSRFWDASADNQTACVIRETGMQCFTGAKSFVSWADIFGSSFVKKYEADQLGEIRKGIYYDGRQFWMKDTLGYYQLISKEDFKLRLRVKYNLSPRVPKGQNASAIDRVMSDIQDNNLIAAALPFVHFPEGLIHQDGERYLNISKIKCMQPAPDLDHPRQWSEGFPWLAKFLDGYFYSGVQLPFFLSWWKHFYQNGLAQTPQSGQAIFIAGPAGVGKTLLSTRIVAASVGGFNDAADFLLGRSTFTAGAISSPLMCVDDSSPAADARDHNVYSAMIKKIVANKYQRYEQKYQSAGQVEWLGRAIITCNTDPESIRLLPNMDISIQDKVSLFQCATRELPMPDNGKTIEQTVTEELPALLSWLIKWTMPRLCVGDPRFGCKPFHDEFLTRSAHEQGSSFSFLEVIQQYMEMEFVNQPDGLFKGSSTELLSALISHPILGPLASRYTSTQIGGWLGQLKARGYPVTQERTTSKRVWVIPVNIGEHND